MSRRMTIRCDGCNRDEDMVYLSEGYSASASGPFTGAVRPGYLPSFGPKPPSGWFERFAGLRGNLDFCSVACVSAWDERNRGSTAIG